MINKDYLNSIFRKMKGWRRLLAFLAALMLFSTSGGISALAEGIYSDPVTAPVPHTSDTPAPDNDPDATPGPGNEDGGEDVTPEVTPEETPEPTPEPTPDRVYYPGTLTAETEGCAVQLDYTAEARIPEDATATVTEASGADYYAAMKSAAKAAHNMTDETWEYLTLEDGQEGMRPYRRTPVTVDGTDWTFYLRFAQELDVNPYLWEGWYQLNVREKSGRACESSGHAVEVSS